MLQEEVEQSTPPLDVEVHEPASSRWQARGSLRRREALTGYLFLSPWLIGMLLFYLGPTAASLFLSFTDYPIIASPRWSGLNNYRQLASDPEFVQSLKVTLIYTVLAVSLYAGGALVLALLGNKKMRGIGLFRTVVFLPSLIPIFIAAVLWGWLFQPDFGIVNYYLDKLGLPTQMWFQSPTLALPLSATITFWAIGSAFLTYLAGLQAIPSELYDAATVDGAGTLRRFMHITFPMLSPVVLFNLVIGLIVSFQAFDVAYVLTHGGPADATLFSVFYIFRKAFVEGLMGYASALAWILFLIIVSTTALIFRTARWWVHYEATLR